jgi:hypothetical protein
MNWSTLRQRVALEIQRLSGSKEGEDRARAAVWKRCLRLLDEALRARTLVNDSLKRVTRIRRTAAWLLADLQGARGRLRVGGGRRAAGVREEVLLGG